MKTITFQVHGDPKPAGSKTPFPVRKKGGGYATCPSGAPIVRVVDACKTSGPWKEAVKYAALQAYRGEPLSGPLYLRVEFRISRPKSHYRKNGELKPNAPHHHTSKPDATKLLRCLEDCLKGIIWRDDNQVAEQHVGKQYGSKPGAHVTIQTLDEEVKG